MLNYYGLLIFIIFYFKVYIILFILFRLGYNYYHIFEIIK